jgi:SAM-dependent methyltransferase
MKPAVFARLFDAQNRQFTEDLPFWLGQAERFRDPILELGSGAGRVLVPLAQAGYRVVGVDNNPHMLQRLDRRLPATLKARVTTILADLDELPLSERFPLILSPCNTLAAFDEEDLEHLLLDLRTHLTDDGALAFEVPPPSAGVPTSEQAEIVDSFHEPEHGADVQVSAAQTFDPVRQVASVHWRYDEMQQDGEVLRFERTVDYHLRSPQEFERTLGDANFDRVQFFGGYQGQPFTQNSEILLVLARPRASVRPRLS